MIDIYEVERLIITKRERTLEEQMYLYDGIFKVSWKHIAEK